MPSEKYSDQPYVVKAKDGAWVMCVTTGQGFEGEGGQHVISSRSTDLGRTWEEPVDVESALSPESSYAVLYATDYGRIYCFYNYNADNVREIPADWPGGVCRRVDSLGHFVFKYSDDFGRSWSEKWYEIPVRLMREDREENPTGGAIPFFWNVGRPFRTERGVYVSLYKIASVGEGTWHNTQGVFLFSENIATERDPERITFVTLPDGEEGVHTDRETEGYVSEEHSTAVLSDGTLYTVFRTGTGHPYYARSFDGGHTFTKPLPLCYREGRPVFHPRAANFLWKCKNGKYLYWHHNANSNTWENRNPAFLSGAVEVSGEGGMTLRFSEAEVALYDDDPTVRISYPDLVEDGGYFLTETQKSIARVHPLEEEMLRDLWRDAEGASLPASGEAVGERLSLPSFVERTATLDAHGERTEASFALGVTHGGARGEVFSAMRMGGGVCLSYDGERYTFRMSDGERNFYLESPAVTAGRHRITVLVDGPARVVRFLIDGEAPPPRDRLLNWGRMPADLGALGWDLPVSLGEGAEALTYYAHRLTAPRASMLVRGMGMHS